MRISNSIKENDKNGEERWTLNFMKYQLFIIGSWYTYCTSPWHSEFNSTCQKIPHLHFGYLKVPPTPQCSHPIIFFWPFLVSFSCFFFQIWKGLSSLFHQLLSPVFERNPSFLPILLSYFCQKPGSQCCSRVCFYSFKFCWIPGFMGHFS